MSIDLVEFEDVGPNKPMPGCGDSGESTSTVIPQQKRTSLLLQPKKKKMMVSSIGGES